MTSKIKYSTKDDNGNDIDVFYYDCDVNKHGIDQMSIFDNLIGLLYRIEKESNSYIESIRIHESTLELLLSQTPFIKVDGGFLILKHSKLKVKMKFNYVEDTSPIIDTSLIAEEHHALRLNFYSAKYSLVELTGLQRIQ